ncbi:type II toxin-antitoxin system RelE/ParE family toxin [Xanthobacteraceae bacterium A53D]
MAKLRYLPTAQRELDSIFDYIAAQNGGPATARSFTKRLLMRCRELARTPGIIGTARPELGQHFRCLPYRGYLIFFRYIDGAVEIIGIIEGHRDVERWSRNAPGAIGNPMTPDED